MIPEEPNELVNKLNSLILKAAPKTQTVSKYGGTLYTLKPEEKEGQFCGIFEYKNHVQLAFSHGTSLKDPKNLLEGTGKYRRHVNFEYDKEIDEAAVKKLIKEAAKFSVQ